MKASELIQELEEMIKIWGDAEINIPAPEKDEYQAPGTVRRLESPRVFIIE